MGITCCGNRIRSGREGRLHRIPNDLEEHALVSFDSGAQDSRWRSTLAAIATRSRSQSAVLPSMSVKRNVTVPLGSSGMIRFRSCGLSWSVPIVA